MIVNAPKIYSILGNPNSLIPLGVKDVSSCLGMTAGSYVTGKEEGFDRFIDEFGTEALWLGGIPAYKWLFDKTAFKAFGFDSKIDPRILKDKEIFNKIKQFAPNSKIKSDLVKVGEHKDIFKKLAATKFAFSTVFAALTYFGMTRLKQKYTENKIRKNLIKEYENSKKEKSQKKDKLSNPSFNGLGKSLEDLAFSPVKNMYLMDGFITSERLLDSRNTQEFIGYSIKEGASLFFLYFAGKKIQEFIEDKANLKYNKSIKLDSRIIEGAGLDSSNGVIVEKDLLRNSFVDGTIQKDIFQFKNASKVDVDLYEFIHKNPNNKIVKFLKLSDSIRMLNDSNKIDTRAYIDLDDARNLNSSVQELYNQFKQAHLEGESTEQFFKGVRKLKRKSINMNIVSCILALGVITPMAMLIKRLTDKNGKEFQTKKEIKEQLIKEGVLV